MGVAVGKAKLVILVVVLGEVEEDGTGLKDGKVVAGVVDDCRDLETILVRLFDWSLRTASDTPCRLDKS